MSTSGPTDIGLQVILTGTGNLCINGSHELSASFWRISFTARHGASEGSLRHPGNGPSGFEHCTSRCGKTHPTSHRCSAPIRHESCRLHAVDHTGPVADPDPFRRPGRFIGAAWTAMHFRGGVEFPDRNPAGIKRYHGRGGRPRMLRAPWHGRNRIVRKHSDSPWPACTIPTITRKPI